MLRAHRLALLFGLLLSGCSASFTTSTTLGGVKLTKRSEVYSVDGVEVPHVRWVTVAMDASAPGSYRLLAFESVELRGVADAAPALEVELRTQYEGDGTVQLGPSGEIDVSSERGGAIAVMKIRGSIANGPPLSVESALGDVSLNAYTSASEIVLEASMGALSAREIQASSVRLNAGMGEIDVGDLHTQRLDSNAGMGALRLAAIEADQIELDVGMGSATLDQVFASNLAIDAGMGDVTLIDCVLEGRLSVDSGMGDLEISGGSIAELDQEMGMGDLKLTNGARIGDS